MKLEDLPDLIKRLEDSSGREKALKASLDELGASMADILELLEKQGPQTAKAIADALRGVKLEAVMPQPHIEIIEKEAPESKTLNGWHFVMDYAPNGAIKGITARPLTK